MQIEENPQELGGGVAVKSIQPGSNAARSLSAAEAVNAKALGHVERMRQHTRGCGGC